MSGILTVVFITVVYMTNRVVPFMMDDLWYSTLLFEETPVSSLADVIRSQVWHYNNWGGRSMTHGILQLILMAGEKAAGPGSFTGLRIGASTAKGLAWAADKPCAPCSTLESMAWPLARSEERRVGKECAA